MQAYQADAWAGFFAAQAGATAAVAGLLFVAISLNLQQILKFRSLPGRAAETFGLLLNLLIASSMGLVPGQTSVVLGAEILVVGLCAWGFPVRLQLRQGRSDQAFRFFVWRVLLCQIATLPFIAAGVSLIAGAGGGLYWLVPGTVGVYVASFANSWVLLVEIDR